MIFGSIAGLQRIPGFPFIFDQSFGVCVGVLIMTLWSARHHLRAVLQQAWSTGSRNHGKRSDLLPDSDIRLNRWVSAIDWFLVDGGAVALGGSARLCHSPDDCDSDYPRPC